MLVWQLQHLLCLSEPCQCLAYELKMESLSKPAKAVAAQTVARSPPTGQPGTATASETNVVKAPPTGPPRPSTASGMVKTPPTGPPGTTTACATTVVKASPPGPPGTTTAYEVKPQSLQAYAKAASSRAASIRALLSTVNQVTALLTACSEIVIRWMAGGNGRPNSMAVFRVMGLNTLASINKSFQTGVHAFLDA